MLKIKENRKDFLHHNNSKIVTAIREIVFGLEDGMVSTLGAVTGVAAGSQDHGIVLLAGFVIISVESISMGIGSYLSNKSEADVKERKLAEERYEIANYPQAEKKSLEKIYLKDGWPAKLAKTMAETAASNKKLMLTEMAYHEMNISPIKRGDAGQRGVYMFFSYVVGGFVPLLAYLFLPINQAIYLSVIITLLALFILGSSTTKYTKKHWFKAGLRIFILGGIALLVGLLVGNLFNYLNY